MIALIILFIALYFTGKYLLSTYNKVVPLQVAIHEGSANIRLIEGKRASVLTALKDLTKGYSDYERELILRISDDLRPGNTGMLTINRLYDAYPNLRYSGRVEDQLNKLIEIEGERQQVIETYHSRVRDYNEEIRLFPENIACALLGFRRMEYYG